jgi:hypothetical protein
MITSKDLRIILTALNDYNMNASFDNWDNSTANYHRANFGNPEKTIQPVIDRIFQELTKREQS